MSRNKNIYNILKGQYSTEKTVMLADKFRSVTFRVFFDVNKFDVKYAVENLFKVSVLSVKIINVKGKRVKFKSISGRRKDWKKAVVILKKGCDINFSETENI